jgi:ABC-type antimicrobial peptide transport system permease subunit
MIKNLFKIAVRNLLQSKTFSLINVLGLAFGLCCALLISLWVLDEYSIDNYHANKDRIFLAISELKSSEGSSFRENSPAPLAEKIMAEVVGVEQAVRYSPKWQQLFKQEHQKLEEIGISADPAILSVFDLPLMSGDAQSALDEPYSVVISMELAHKLFPNGEALNKTVTIDDWGNEHAYKITGVMDEIPRQSTFEFDFIIPFETYKKAPYRSFEWDDYNVQTILLLEENVDLHKIEEQVAYIIPENPEEARTEMHLYAFKDLYLHADISNGLAAEGRMQYVRIFSIIGFMILLIACINFMNLSTARAGKRAKEVGVRKTIGASRNALVIQFLGESVLIALISGAIAVTMADLLMPYFNSLTGKTLTVLYSTPSFTLAMLLLCVLTGLIAGIYPAIYLSKFNPSKVLKNATGGGKSLSGFRRVLVVLQFSLSITFVVTTIIVYSQLQFILNKDIGLEKENMLRHDLNGIMGNKTAFRNEIIQIPGVQAMSCTNSSPFNIRRSTNLISWNGKNTNDEVYVRVIQTDQYFVETFGVTLLEGRNFTDTYDATLPEVMMNEQAAEMMSLEHVVGSSINFYGEEVQVVGLLKNFNHQSLDKNIEPVIVRYSPQTWLGFIVINGDISQTREKIEEVYSKFETNYPFNYGFVEQDYEDTYAEVSNMGQLSNVFALVTIIVSCLGLFGLASYMTEQRKKETGIRKVMGASVFGLVTMFTQNFLGLVLTALAISAPVAWYLSSQWLNDFAFKIDLGVQPFLIGGLSAVLVAIATVSYHTIRVAMANPVDSLKYE